MKVNALRKGIAIYPELLGVGGTFLIPVLQQHKIKLFPGKSVRVTFGISSAPLLIGGECIYICTKSFSWYQLYCL